MRFRRTLLATVALFATLARPAASQPGGMPAAESLVKAEASEVTLQAGARGETVVQLAITLGWHIHANPPAHDYLIPTTVNVTPGFGLGAGKPIFPAPQRMKFAFEEGELLVYGGAAQLRVPILATADAQNGRHVLHGKVEYQACNDQLCLPPTSVPFDLIVTVTGGRDGPPPPIGSTPGGTDSTVTPTAADSTDLVPTAGAGFITGPPDGATTNPALDNPIARMLGGSGWVALLSLFMLGLSLNLTPCVFPMLGVTVSIFGARKRSSPLHALAMASIYVLGICVMYTVLGVVAALTGGLFGAALQSPLVTVGIGVLLIALSLSMFGVYELQLPAVLLSKLGGASTTSVAGVFFSGLLVGVFAAPCTGPPVVALLAVVAAKGDPWFGFQTFFLLSLGLGAPYLVLGTFSNLLQNLPRSGEWMVWVKKVFGVVMAAIGLFYALLGVAPRASSWVLPAGLLLGGLYLGFMEKSANNRRSFRLMKNIAGTIAVVLAVWLTLGLMRAGITFQSYTEAAVRMSLAKGRPVILDFSASWCGPCHELEERTFTDRAVIGAAADFDVYKVDLTKWSASEAVRRQYAVAGVPSIVFLRPDGTEARALRVQEYVPPVQFLERMRVARGAR